MAFDSNHYNKMKESLEAARKELAHATHLEESGRNPGIRKMNANKAEWLSWVIYLAEQGLRDEQLAQEPVVAVKEEPKTDFEKVRMLFQMIKDNPVN